MTKTTQEEVAIIAYENLAIVFKAAVMYSPPYDVIYKAIEDIVKSTVESVRSANELAQILEDLKDAGCFPTIHWRGNVWRFHINICGDQWAEDKSVLAAAKCAMETWTKLGKPMDGEAAGYTKQP